MKKVIGILFILLGSVGAILSALLLTVPISEAFEYGADTVEWGVASFVALVLVIMLVLIFCGVILFRDQKRIKSEVPENRTIVQRSEGAAYESMEQTVYPETGVESMEQMVYPKTGVLELAQEEWTTHVYQSAWVLCIAEFLKKLVLCSFLLFMLLLMIGTMFFNVRNSSNGILPVILCSVFPSFLFSVFWAFYWCRIRIHINAAGLSFYRGEKRYASYPLEAPFYPSVTKNSYYGILINTSREFRLVVRKNLHKAIPCWCVNEKDFSRLVEDIETLRQGEIYESQERPSVEAIYEEADNSRFILPKKELLSNERRRLTAVVAGCLAVGTILALLWYFLYYKLPFDEFAFRCMLFIALIFPIPAGLMQGLRYRGISRSMPETLYLTGSGIRVNENTVTTASIKEVTMTPPDYAQSKNQTSYRRYLTLVIREGKQEYLLGSTPASPRNLVYRDYEKLVTAMRQWCGKHGVAFRLEME